MSFNIFMTYFPFILVCLTVISGLIWLVDHLMFKTKRLALDENNPAKKEPWIVDYSISFFPVFLIVLIIRSFIFQPYKVPTGSLEPTVHPGDFLLVTQYSYGLHLPVWGTQIIPISNPKRGDIAVFHWPVNPNIDFVKRVIGIPGDHISLINHILYINGQKAKQTYVGPTTDSDSPGGPSWPDKIMQENLLGLKHQILLCDNNITCPAKRQDFKDLVIPKGEYLMMGDNRGNSDDGRNWGLVPRNLIFGKGQVILMSWNSAANWKHKIRFNRIGSRLNPHFFKF